MQIFLYILYLLKYFLSFLKGRVQFDLQMEGAVHNSREVMPGARVSWSPIICNQDAERDEWCTQLTLMFIQSRSSPI